jgi:hypothetical protein
MSDFELGEGFARAEVSGMLGLGPLEAQYQDLFADVLEDGVITAEERLQLERAADNLGLDRTRLLQLEQAMIAAYEAHHRVHIVEHYEPTAESLVVPFGGTERADRERLVARIRELEGRVRELEEELKKAQAAVNVEVDLSELDTQVHAANEDPEEIWRAIRRDPTAPEHHRALFRVTAARGELDRQWCAAQVLVALGAARPEEAALFEAHRTELLIAPRTGVSASAWHDLLVHPEQELLTGAIFGVIAPAVLVGRVATLRREGKLPAPDASKKQDLAQCTLTAVRALPWAASILGLAPPAVYADKDRDTGYSLIPGVPPFTMVGKRVLSGCSHLEHAFLAGRHLTSYRQDHFIKVLFSAVPDLEDLFLAALTIGNPRLPITAELQRRVAPIARAIEPLLAPQQVDALRGHYLRFVEEGGRTNLMRWSTGVEKTACRAGLLLAGDLGVALRLLAEDEGALGELGKDVVAFSVSDRYGALRRQLGIGLGGLQAA